MAATFSPSIDLTNNLEDEFILVWCTAFQKKKLLSLYYDKVEVLVKKLLILDGDSERLTDLTYLHYFKQNLLFIDGEPIIFCFAFPCSEVSFEHFLWYVA